jgi:hypothetical protein
MSKLTIFGSTYCGRRWPKAAILNNLDIIESGHYFFSRQIQTGAMFRQFATLRFAVSLAK